MSSTLALATPIGASSHADSGIAEAADLYVCGKGGVYACDAVGRRGVVVRLFSADAIIALPPLLPPSPRDAGGGIAGGGIAGGRAADGCVCFWLPDLRDSWRCGGIWPIICGSFCGGSLTLDDEGPA
jgi:hypothetical protein